MLSSSSNETEPRTGMTALRKTSAPSGTASGHQGRPDLSQYRRRRPDHGHRRGGANVSDQHGQAAAPRHIDPAAHRRGRRADEELPDPAAAVQEEDQREQHQQHLGHGLADGGRRGQPAAGDTGLIRAEGGKKLVASRGQLPAARQQIGRRCR